MAHSETGDTPTLEQKLAQFNQAIGANAIQRLRGYEALHGPVTPAPYKARINRRSSEAQIMAIIKRRLLTSGWLKE